MRWWHRTLVRPLPLVVKEESETDYVGIWWDFLKKKSWGQSFKKYFTNPICRKCSLLLKFVNNTKLVLETCYNKDDNQNMEYGKEQKNLQWDSSYNINLISHPLEATEEEKDAHILSDWRMTVSHECSTIVKNKKCSLRICRLNYLQ